MNIEIHHIGFVVDNILQNIQIFELLGFQKEGDMIEDFNQNNILQMMVDKLGTRIELIEPMNEKSTVNKNNLGLHHLAVSADSEEELLKIIKEKRIGKIFTDKIKAPLFENKNVSFGFLKNNLLFEIIYKN